MEEGCVATLVKITGILSVRETIKGSVTIPKGFNQEPYEGPYEVMPSTRDDVVLETKKKRMTDDVTVFKIPYFETSNESGYTVYIASEV